MPLSSCLMALRLTSVSVSGLPDSSGFWVRLTVSFSLLVWVPMSYSSHQPLPQGWIRSLVLQQLARPSFTSGNFSTPNHPKIWCECLPRSDLEVAPVPMRAGVPQSHAYNSQDSQSRPNTRHGRQGPADRVGARLSAPALTMLPLLSASWPHWPSLSFWNGPAS